MRVSRRGFVRLGAAAAASAACGEAPALLAARRALPEAPVRTAGIRLIPRDGGKFKVWTARA